MKSRPIVDYVITLHAAVEIQRRGLNEQIIPPILAAPEQRLPVRPGRDVLQSRVSMGSKIYLVRVFVDVDRCPAEVVTAYRTSKVEKYWRQES